MRNIWYPQKRAEYVTTAKLKDLGTKDAVLEWDASFESEMEVEIEDEAGKENDMKKKVTPTFVEMEHVKPIELELMSVRPFLPPLQLNEEDFDSHFTQPEQAADVLSSLLPPNIEFYRTPIPVKVEPPAKRLSPSIATNSAISAAATAAAPEAKPAKKPEKTSIYGSVSTSDIAANLKAILAENEEGARVILSPEDITFVEETEDIDRVKHLGIFEVDIRPKGAPDAIRRTIQVNAQN